MIDSKTRIKTVQNIAELRTIISCVERELDRQDSDWILAAYILGDCIPFVSKTLADLLGTMSSTSRGGGCIHKNDICGAIEDIQREIDEATVWLLNENVQLREAAKWLVNIGCGIGRAGGLPEPGEFESAIDFGKFVLQEDICD